MNSSIEPAIATTGTATTGTATTGTATTGISTTTAAQTTANRSRPSKHSLFKLPTRIQALATSLIGASCVLIAAPVKPAELTPNAVINGVYEGIQQIHGYQATPRLVWDVRMGDRGGCGAVRGSHYCGRNHTVYITRQDVQMAYQHGDAALAYIVAHEYAHAMQSAFGFMPRTTAIAELQADCLAGAYLRAIPTMSLDQRDIQEIGTFAYRVGDYAWRSRHHHGTPAQRVKAVTLGMQSSSQAKGLSVCRLN